MKKLVAQLTNDMNIGKKLIISFITVCIISSLAGVLSTFLLKSSDDEYSNLLVNYGFAQGNTALAINYLSETRSHTLGVVSMSKQENIDFSLASLKESRKHLDEYLKKCEGEFTDEKNKEYFINIVLPMVDDYYKIVDHLVEVGNTTDESKSSEVRGELVNTLDPQFEKLYNELDTIMKRKQETGTLTSEKLTNTSRIYIVLNIAIIIISIAVSIFIALFISKSIVVPIQACAKRLDDLAKGDLKSPVPVVTNKDEIAILAKSTESITITIMDIIGDLEYALKEIGSGNLTVRSKNEAMYIGDFNSLSLSMYKILSQLSDTMLQINYASDQVSGAAEQVADAAQSLAQGACEQASSLEELSATVNEISFKVNHTAENASKAKTQAEESGEIVAVSNNKMNEISLAMNNIDKKSAEIEKIIKTIEDIAAQTNLLALNAAIEAARVGDAGKGFAVVADEVRKLAAQSAESAQNTAILISETLDAVQTGVELVDDAKSSMSQVVESSDNIINLVDDISVASDEQALAISQITEGVDLISSVVETNSATSEETAAASQELSSQASLLKEQIEQFRLE